MTPAGLKEKLDDKPKVETPPADAPAPAPEVLSLTADQLQQMLRQAAMDALEEKAREEQVKQDAATAARLEAEKIRQQKAQIFADLTPQLQDLAHAYLAAHGPEQFTKPKEKGSDVRVPAGSGIALGGELTVTLADGTVKVARLDARFVWDDNDRRKARSLPADSLAIEDGRRMLDGVTD